MSNLFVRRVAAASVVCAFGVTLAACTPPAGDSSPEDDGDLAPLIVYSNSLSEGRGDWLTGQAEEEGFALELVELGGSDVQNRLLAEVNNPIADVTFGLNDVNMRRLAEAGALTAYTPEWSSKVDSGLGDGESYWPTVEEPINLVYNEAEFSASGDAPEDWSDIWESDDFAGRYEVPTNLGGGTSQMVIAGILSRFLDDSGELGVSDEGWAAIKKYFENGVPAEEGVDLYARMVEGEVGIGQMWLAGKVTRDAEYKLSTSVIPNAEGVPFVRQYIGIVNGTENEETAQRFVDWFGSASVQAAWSNEFFTSPTNSDAASDADTAAVDASNLLPVQDIDWDVVTENLDAWVEKITLEYVQQ